jgi:hypothetical protein
LKYDGLHLGQQKLTSSQNSAALPKQRKNKTKEKSNIYATNFVRNNKKPFTLLSKKQSA